MISLCMIVKNEEMHLGTCLAGVAGKVDELVVVDTGSSDKTKSIALKFTDKVYDYKWHDDFAAARNFSVSKATHDWILVLDADEYVDGFIREEVEAFVNDPNNIKTVGRITVVNLLENAGEGKKYTDEISRLFNKRFFQYEGTIHEQIFSRDGSTFDRAPVGITALHVGYSKEAIAMAGKLERNEGMLLKAVENNPQDPYLYFQLGKTYFMMKKYGAAASYFEKSLTHDLDYRLDYVEDLIETYGYSLINSGRYKEALDIERYIEFYSNSADFHFLLGLIYMNNALFTRSVESFLECTKFSRGRMEGVFSFLAYYNVGVIYEILGFRDQAIEYYRLCGPYSHALERLKKI